MTSVPARYSPCEAGGVSKSDNQPTQNDRFRVSCIRFDLRRRLPRGLSAGRNHHLQLDGIMQKGVNPQNIKK